MSGHVEFVVNKVAPEQGFSEYFGFPYQFSLYRLLYTHHLSSGSGTIGQLLADVPIGLSLTPPQETKFLREVSEHLTLAHYSLGSEILKKLFR
jgi:hypothetical protein